MRLIDADELETKLLNMLDLHSEIENPMAIVLLQVAIDIVKKMDTVKATPARCGTWKHVLGMNSKCSECGHYFPVKDFESRPFDINYCPQCGAKMDGGDVST